jgi:hypothetical protein
MRNLLPGGASFTVYLFYGIEWFCPDLTQIALLIKLNKKVGIHSEEEEKWGLQYIENCNTCIQSRIV